MTEAYITYDRTLCRTRNKKVTRHERVMSMNAKANVIVRVGALRVQRDEEKGMDMAVMSHTIAIDSQTYSK